MKTTIKILAVFFAPAVFVLYCWGAYQLVRVFVEDPQGALVVAGGVILIQVLGVFAAGEVGFFESAEGMEDEDRQ
jgi:hypothetical protein